MNSLRMLSRTLPGVRTLSSSSRSLKYLIIDGYDKAGRDDLRAGGASEAGVLFDKMMRKCTQRAGFQGEVVTDIVYPADPGFSVNNLIASFDKYDGLLWTGCSLTIYEDKDPRVSPQIEIAKQAFEHGIPSFGSCWAAQIAVVAAGGKCALNPRGREMGFCRKVSLSAEGRSHPMFEGKPSTFDAFTSHNDEITHLPRSAMNLAGNHWTTIQAVSVSHKKGDFWAVQYHPEYDLYELARLTHCRRQRLIDLGFFQSMEAADHYVSQLETLHKDPSRKDIAWLLGIDGDTMDEAVRLCEPYNWVTKQVLPRFQLRQ